jgi:hypothetical protein
MKGGYHLRVATCMEDNIKVELKKNAYVRYLEIKDLRDREEVTRGLKNA